MTETLPNDRPDCEEILKNQHLWAISDDESKNLNLIDKISF
jgi:hypothetical protein